jgi:hypothetical protein
MKQLLGLISVIVLNSCWNNSIEQENLIQADKIDSVTLIDSSNSFVPKTDRCNGLRALVQGKLIYDTVWSQDRTNTYMTLLSINYLPEKEFGGIYINQWKWGESKPELEWTYVDTLSCGWEDVSIHYDLDSLIISDIDGDCKNDIVLIYTLDCTTDISPMVRYLIVLDTNGKVKLKLNGWTKDPASHTSISQIDFRYNPKKDNYNPNSSEGKIENYSRLDKLDARTRSRLIDLWKLAFLKK